MVTNGFILQLTNVVVVSIQSILLPYLVGVSQYGEEIYLLSVSFIVQGLYEPISQLTLIRNDRIVVGPCQIANDTIVIAIISAILVFISCNGKAPLLITCLLIIQAFLYILVTFLRSYLISIKRYALIPVINFGGICAGLLSVFLSCNYRVIWFNVIFVSFSLLLSINIVFNSRKELWDSCLSGMIRLNLFERVNFYASCVSSRLIYILINSGMLFILGKSGSFDDVAAYKLITSIMNAGNYLSPYPPAFFLAKITDKNIKRLFVLRAFVIVNTIWISYSIILFILFPNIWYLLYSQTWVNFGHYLILATCMYLSLQLLGYMFNSFYIGNKNASLFILLNFSIVAVGLKMALKYNVFNVVFILIFISFGLGMFLTRRVLFPKKQNV